MLNIKSPDAIYEVLERAFSKSTEPLTCSMLMDQTEVRSAAIAKFGTDVQISTNKLSDVLSFMWRKGVLDRFPAPLTIGRARYAYALRNQIVSTSPLSKHTLEIVERDNEIILDFKQFTIVIKPK